MTIKCCSVPGCCVWDWQEEPNMSQKATECTFPTNGDPEECFPAGTGCGGKFLWSRTGTPGQHLDGSAAHATGIRYNQKSVTWCTVAHDFLWFFPLSTALALDSRCSWTCSSGCAMSAHLWSTSVFAVFYMATVTEFGCIPVSTMYHTKKDGWFVTRSVHAHDNLQRGSDRFLTRSAFWGAID